MGFFGHFFSFFRRKSLPEHIEDQLEERRLRPRVNPREGTRILVIDDSPTILTAMKRFLESAHCVFLGALDAKMGMEVALTQKPDMIFLDIVMPGINGFAALRALRKNSRTRETPIIMMSGNEQAKAQFFGAHIGADDFMKKPFSRFEVFARIARLLDTDRVPRRPSASGAPVQDGAQASSEEAIAQQAPPPPPEPSSAPSSEEVAVPATPDEPSDPILVASQIVAEPPVPEPVPESPQPVARSPRSRIRAVPVVEEKPAAPPEAPPEPSPVPEPPSAQVLPITQQPVQSPSPSVSPELLSRIARLAQLAQSDPEALKALVVLSAQLTAQYAAATGAGTSRETVTRAKAT